MTEGPGPRVRIGRSRTTPRVRNGFGNDALARATKRWGVAMYTAGAADIDPRPLESDGVQHQKPR